MGEEGEKEAGKGLAVAVTGYGKTSIYDPRRLAGVNVYREVAHLVLLQYPNDLLFPIPALLNPQSSPTHYERTLVFHGRLFREHWSLPCLIMMWFAEILHICL